MKKQLFGVIRKKNIRIQMADFHKLIGITTLLFNLMIAITGAWLGLQGYLQPVLVGDRPGIYKPNELKYSEEEDIAINVDFISAYKQTRLLFPEFIPSYFRPSKDGSGTITIAGSVPRTAFERDSFFLTLTKENLEEVHRYDIRQASLGEKVFYIQESLHFGDFAGFILKIIYAILGITSGFLALTGFIIYLKRTERRRKEKPSFIELKPLLLKWTYGIVGVCALLISLSIAFGIVVPTILVIATLYISLAFMLVRSIFIFVKAKLANKMQV
jgi:uncharacterized iron-regulated membrane protein